MKTIHFAMGVENFSWSYGSLFFSKIRQDLGGFLCYLPLLEAQIPVSSDPYRSTSWKDTSLFAVSFREMKHKKGKRKKMLFVYQQCIGLLWGLDHGEGLTDLLGIPGGHWSGKADCWCPGLCAVETIKRRGEGLCEQLTRRAIKSTGFSYHNDLDNTSICLERDPAGGIIQQGIKCIGEIWYLRESRGFFSLKTNRRNSLRVSRQKVKLRGVEDVLYSFYDGNEKGNNIGRLQKSANLPLCGGKSGSVVRDKPQVGEWGPKEVETIK